MLEQQQRIVRGVGRDGDADGRVGGSNDLRGAGETGTIIVGIGAVRGPDDQP